MKVWSKKAIGGDKELRYSSGGRALAWDKWGPEFHPQHCINWLWCILAIDGGRQKNQMSRVILSYVNVSSSPIWDTWDFTKRGWREREDNNGGGKKPRPQGCALNPSQCMVYANIPARLVFKPMALVFVQRHLSLLLNVAIGPGVFLSVSHWFLMGIWAMAPGDFPVGDGIGDMLCSRPWGGHLTSQVW